MEIDRLLDRPAKLPLAAPEIEIDSESVSSLVALTVAAPLIVSLRNSRTVTLMRGPLPLQVSLFPSILHLRDEQRQEIVIDRELQAFFAGLLDLEVCRAGDDDGREVLNHTGLGLEIAGAFDHQPAIGAGPVAGGEQEQGRENSSDSQHDTSLPGMGGMSAGLKRPNDFGSRAEWSAPPSPSVTAITLFMLVDASPARR